MERYAGARGLAALRQALVLALRDLSEIGAFAVVPSPAGATAKPRHGTCFTEATTSGPASPSGPSRGVPDAEGEAWSSEEDSAERTRLIALVELARGGDADAFGLLYDHYHVAVYRFILSRTRAVQLAEDLTSETFFRALRSMTGFRWQGKDFGAWLMTIARNLTTDHFKAGRTRLELTTEDMGLHDDATESPEQLVLAEITNEMLLRSLSRLADEQRECIVMRFLQGMSIAETAAVLGRSEGAIKQLQLRGIRNLAKLLPEGIR